MNNVRSIYSYIVAVFLIITSCVTKTQDSMPLPFYKETEHFKLFCIPQDREVSDVMLKNSEIFFGELSKAFHHNYSTQIIIKIYPDLSSFHNAINQPDAPDWVIGQTENNVDLRVSPNNPGPRHDYESAMRASKVGIATAFIQDKYPNKEMPRWLHQGLALYKAQYPSVRQLERLINNIDQLPATFASFEYINDNVGFEKFNGFSVSYSLVEFLDAQWGWDVVCALLEDYAGFEKILKIDKETFYQQWIQFLKSKQKNN